MLRNILMIISIILMLVILVAILFLLFCNEDSPQKYELLVERQTTQILREQLIQASLRYDIDTLYQYRQLRRLGVMIIITLITLSGLSYGWARIINNYRKVSIITQHLGGAQISVHRNTIKDYDITKLVEILLQLQLLHANTKKSLPQLSTLTPHNQPLAIPQPVLPDFGTILRSLTPGDKMVLGYDYNTQDPKTGTFDQIYSCGIYGVSGSGKTNGLNSIVCQSLLSYPDISYWVIDPHAVRDESLTQQLPKTQHFRHIHLDNLIEGLNNFVRIMDMRLSSTTDYNSKPLVLLIDELPIVMRQAANAITTVLGRIAAEGRKVACYCLISGQDTRMKAAGGQRDLLASQLVYNLKKQQASYLLRDVDIVNLHATVRQKKEPGLCVLIPTDDHPVVLKQPHCQKKDKLWLENHVNTTTIPVDTIDTLVAIRKPEQDTDIDTTNVVSIIRQKLAKNTLQQKQISEATNVSPTLLSRILNGKRTASKDVARKLSDYIKTL
jgi:hypothetical protein